jgi:alkanesulfonate monooxygenase SsuD/methylene tetrahydromethanopterin reductase-like flavin-dependent oxidoreductase (luciferase family)
MSPTADRDKLSAQDVKVLTERGFERFFSTESLMGTPETAATFLDQLSTLGIDEVACLVDFGIPEDPVLRSLELLSELRDTAAAPGRGWVKGTAS